MGPKKYIKKEESRLYKQKEESQLYKQKEESRLYKQKEIKSIRESTNRDRFEQEQKSSKKSKILTESIVRQINSQQRLKRSQSQAVLDNFDEDDDEAQPFPFDFNNTKILHLWLVNILPDTRNNKYKINLSDKKIIGNRIECQMKIKQCEDHLKKYKIKSLIKLQKQFDQYFLLFLKINDVKVYSKSIIMDVLQEIDRKFKYKNINKILQKLQGPFFYLVSLKNQLEAGFTQWFKQNQRTKIQKDQIENARKKGISIFLKYSNPQKSLDQSSSFKKEKKKEKSDDEQQQQSVQDQNQENEGTFKFGFYGVDSVQTKVQKTKETEKVQQRKVENLKQEKANEKNQKNQNNSDGDKKLKFIKKGQISKSIVNNSAFKEQKKYIIFKQRYSKQSLDLEDLKKWIMHNRTLKFDEFIFEVDGDSIIIMINTKFQQKIKLEAFNIYLKFSKIIIIHTLSPENRQKVIQKFCREKQPVKCQLREGYMETSTHENKLRSLIIDGKINKTDRFSKKFIVLWIEGLKIGVQRINKKINNFIQQLPKEDKQENIIINLPKIQKYINEDRVQDLCKQVIRSYIMKNYQQISIKDINIFSQKVTLKLKIKHQFYQEFMNEEKHIKKLTEGIDKSIFIDQMFDSHDLTTELSNKYLLFPSKENPAKVVIIEDQSRSSYIIKELMNYKIVNQQSLQTYETNFNKGRMQLLKNYIDELNTIAKLKDFLQNIKISFDGENKIVVFGKKKNAHQIHNMINLYLAKLSDTIMEKTLIISEIEVGVMEKNMEKFKKDIQNEYKLSINLSKCIDYGAIISINPTKSNDFEQAPLIIFIQKHNHLSKLPRKTIVGFQSQRDLNFINQKMFIPMKAYFSTQKKDAINLKEDSQRETTYIYSQCFTNKTEDLLNYMYNVYPYKNENIKKFAFIMPKQNKNKFILSIINVYEKFIQKNKINIYVLEQSQQNISSALGNLEQQYKDLQKATKYFIFDQKQFYYSKQGDQKINRALKKGEKKVYLTNEDLNLQNITHKCSFNQKKLVHIQSGKQKEIQIQNKRYLIELNGNIYEIPDKQVQKVLRQEPQVGWVQISLGIYELNFKEMQQTNLFTGFVRELRKKEIGVEKKTHHIQIDFNYKVNEIQIPYDDNQQQTATKAIERIKVLLSGQKIKLQHKLEKKITDSQFDKLKEVAKDFDIIAEWDGNQKITFTYYDKINIANLTKNMKYILSQEKKEIKYPQNWDKIEESEIKTFIVDKKTKQFEEIQKAFTLASITELVRIQNTYVYKKYLDEKICLTQLNGGKEVRQLKLFHGTRTTDPKTIYQDKEQSFNINYTSDNNYLGRGTYFAVRSQYSHNYSYVNQNYSVEEPNSNIVSRIFQRRNVPAREMFYCSVLVGDSQNVAVVDAKSQAMRDTDFKNVAQRIRFESSTTFTNGSVIYAVYKNRRAYPEYLIRY